MPYYPIVDMASMGPRNLEVGAKAEIVTLRSGDEFVLPVFTSVARLWAFVDEYFAEDDPRRPSTFPLDPLRLAEMIEPLGEAGALGSLVFNPIAVSVGQWRSAKEPIPVAHFGRFIAEIRPGIQQVTQDSVRKFGNTAPGSSAYEEAMEWCGPRIEAISKDAGGRVDAWWKRHGT